MSKLSRHRRHTAYWDNIPGLFDHPALQDTSGEEGTDELPALDEHTLARPEKLRFMSFGSGSSGNCSYIGTAECGVLIDAGVDLSLVGKALAENAINPQSIQGILLTHDHGDHVRYAYGLLRRYRHFRLFATPKTLGGILRRHNISRRISDYHQPIYKEFPFKAGSLTITAYETSHDGTDNVGFYIEGANTSFAITTDTGVITERADHYMRLARHLVLESNYDAEMLRKGSYPQYLKARIISERGHLDNEVAADYLRRIFRPELATVLLCHLSEENNLPELALECSLKALTEAGARIAELTASAEERAGRTVLATLPRKEASALLILD
ncbi:MAG: MBL fold metallo-hydrolase [Muribaculaceae bacterium]|nr:MBL fold metallo-hydrolase [Muribaculaceae bacterium]